MTRAEVQARYQASIKGKEATRRRLDKLKSQRKSKAKAKRKQERKQARRQAKLEAMYTSEFEAWQSRQAADKK